MPLTLKQLMRHYDGFLINQWDHTAMISAQVYNVGVLLVNVASKKARARTKTLTDMHPFRERRRRGLVIKPNEIGVLRTLATALMRQKG